MLSAMAWVVGAGEPSGNEEQQAPQEGQRGRPSLKRIDTAVAEGSKRERSPRAGCDLPSPKAGDEAQSTSDDTATLPPTPPNQQGSKICELKARDLELMHARTTAEMEAQNEAIAKADADRKAREAEGLERKKNLAEELSKKVDEDRLRREKDFEATEAARRQVLEASWEAPQPTSVIQKAFYTGEMSVDDAKKVTSKGKVGAAAAAFSALEAPVLKQRERDAEVKKKAAEELEARRKAKAEAEARARQLKEEEQARKRAEEEAERERLAQEEARRRKEQEDREFEARMAEEAKLNEAERAVLKAKQAEEKARFLAEAPENVIRRLKDGIEVSKHSRNGHTVRRVLLSEDRVMTLSWCKPDHKHLTPEKTFNMTACRGVRGGLDLDPNEVNEVTGTAVLRARAPADLARSFALIFDNRTLDFTCDSAKDCRLLVAGLKSILFPQLRHI